MFVRDDNPNVISNSDSTPEPPTCGEALSDFPKTHCDFGSPVKNQIIIANIDICGDLTGASSHELIGVS
ncbi:uncharacterized protein N7503_011980 [Penicillium pulvis]|uniref:uncharacterized protein n=1 Tax=Penicillium pulvis TaxID=1562058 RepID=UPI002549A411|nr:uncharacterized protein N7503_011980 [Penicillium pulvis]KAJ5786768.1 hypothetical protein N7503_011980 [Penicillium pulvis]